MGRHIAIARSLTASLLVAGMLAGCDEAASWQSSKDKAHRAVVEAMCARTQGDLARAIGNIADAATGIPEPERKTRFETEARGVTQSD